MRRVRLLDPSDPHSCSYPSHVKALLCFFFRSLLPGTAFMQPVVDQLDALLTGAKINVTVYEGQVGENNRYEA